MGRGVRTSALDQPVRMALPAVILTPGLDMGVRLSRGNGCRGSAIKGIVASGVERISVHQFGRSIGRFAALAFLVAVNGVQ